MMAGNPNWWPMFPPSFNSFADQPQSWSQLLLGDEDRVLNQTQMSHYQPKKLENWEDQILNNNNINSPSQVEASNFVDIVKQEVSNNIRDHSLNILHPTLNTSHHTNKFLDFSCNTNNQDHTTNQSTPRGADSDHSSELKNHSGPAGAVGGACKKAKVHPPSSSQPPLKVRKEKLVDRITALHQIVSPFGKTDTASVLSEAIGYIRFLQGQIEALSYPYLQNAPKDSRNSQPVGEEIMKIEEKPLKDLRSRGLCLVPVSCTHLVGGDNNNNNAAAYWAPAYGTGF
ncbi:LOW QUALITY PROTEIN: transcription factor bHLH133-like [Benincasa hispida]|uniref:LOW QUALITY PROTEIN: transcription factor bHLH133-like n=1 Tax=Benincasa hispida TaxID=102211 RepID=UPI00190133AC|nr:LOW QUALITY PROTEIN: transcription factor bHLH133-like [Benincasa hispida]